MIRLVDTGLENEDLTNTSGEFRRFLKDNPISKIIIKTEKQKFKYFYLGIFTEAEKVVPELIKKERQNEAITSEFIVAEFNKQGKKVYFSIDEIQKAKLREKQRVFGKQQIEEFLEARTYVKRSYKFTDNFFKNNIEEIKNELQEDIKNKTKYEIENLYRNLHLTYYNREGKIEATIEIEYNTHDFVKSLGYEGKERILVIEQYSQNGVKEVLGDNGFFDKIPEDLEKVLDDACKRYEEILKSRFDALEDYFKNLDIKG